MSRLTSEQYEQLEALEQRAHRPRVGAWALIGGALLAVVVAGLVVLSQSKALQLSGQVEAFEAELAQENEKRQIVMQALRQAQAGGTSGDEPTTLAINTKSLERRLEPITQDLQVFERPSSAVVSFSVPPRAYWATREQLADWIIVQEDIRVLGNRLEVSLDVFPKND